MPLNEIRERSLSRVPGCTGRLTDGTINLVDDDAVGLLGSQDSLHLARVGDAAVQGGT